MILSHQMVFILSIAISTFFVITATSLNSKIFLNFNIKKFIANSIFSTSIFFASTSVITPYHSSAHAVASISGAQTFIYKTGKAPYLVSTGSSDSATSKDDKYPGSKKDSSFLRSMSNCKTRCQQPGEGLAKNDCVQDCQDQTCNSYEQCSFRIKSTMGNAI